MSRERCRRRCSPTARVCAKSWIVLLPKRWQASRRWRPASTDSQSRSFLRISRRRFATTSFKGSRGSCSFAKRVWARSSRTTWASEKRCKPSARSPGKLSSWRRPASFITGRTKSGASGRRWRPASITVRNARSTPRPTSRSRATRSCAWTKKSWPSPPGTRSSSTRRSRSRIRRVRSRRSRTG